MFRSQDEQYSLTKHYAIMKKLLYIAMAAFVLMACNTNDPKIDRKDNKMLDKASKGALALLGKQKSDVVAKMKDLGFQEGAPSAAPARTGLPAKAVNDHSLTFVYGDMDKYMDAVVGDDLNVFVDYLIDSKEVFVMAFLTFDDKDQLVSCEAHLHASQRVKNIHNLYTNFSQNLFLSLDKNKEWSGGLCTIDDAKAGKASKEYADASQRDKFVEDFAALAVPFAREEGADAFDDTLNRVYNLTWLGDASLEVPQFDGLVEGMLFFGLQEPEPDSEP